MQNVEGHAVVRFCIDCGNVIETCKILMNSCDDRILAAELGVHLLQFNWARFGNLRRALFLQLGFFELTQVGFWITVVSCASKPEGHSAKIYCCEGLSG